MSAFTTAATSNRTSRKRPLSNGAVESTAVKRRFGRSAAAVRIFLHMSEKYDNIAPACLKLKLKIQDASRLKRNQVQLLKTFPKTTPDQSRRRTFMCESGP